jgi:hypothetical protein
MDKLLKILNDKDILTYDSWNNFFLSYYKKNIGDKKIKLISIPLEEIFAHNYDKKILDEKLKKDPNLYNELVELRDILKPYIKKQLIILKIITILWIIC